MVHKCKNNANMVPLFQGYTTRLSELTAYLPEEVTSNAQKLECLSRRKGHYPCCIVLYIVLPFELTVPINEEQQVKCSIEWFENKYIYIHSYLFIFTFIYVFIYQSFIIAVVIYLYPYFILIFLFIYLFIYVNIFIYLFIYLHVCIYCLFIIMLVVYSSCFYCCCRRHHVKNDLYTKMYMKLDETFVNKTVINIDRLLTFTATLFH